MLSLQIPPEICASICSEVDERRSLALLCRTSSLFRDQAEHILYRSVDLEECNLRGVKSWCLAVTRHARLAERVHALALLLPVNLDPADATKIGVALSRCINLKELRVSGEAYLIGRHCNSLNGWLINDCPFRLTKFANSYFNNEWINAFFQAQSEIRVLEGRGSFRRFDGQLPNLIAAGVQSLWDLPSERPLQRIQMPFQNNYSALGRYASTLTTLYLLREWPDRSVTVLDTLLSIADLLPVLVNLGVSEIVKKDEYAFADTAPTLTLQRFPRMETFILHVRNVVRFSDQITDDEYDMHIASDREAMGRAIMAACPRLRWTVIAAEVRWDKEVTCTVRRSVGGAVSSEAGTEFKLDAVSMFWKP